MLQTQEAESDTKIIRSLEPLRDHVISKLLRLESGTSPQPAIEQLLAELEPSTLAYFYKLLIKENVQVKLSEQPVGVTPSEMAVIFLRTYIWQFVADDSAISKKFGLAA
jgi:hypothetical protein